MHRIVSYSLFGLKDTYWRVIPTLVRAHLCIFPNWKLRIHYSRDVISHPYWPVLASLCGSNFIQLECRSSGEGLQLCEGMLWRLFPVWSGSTLDEIRTVACRDIDSLPTVRDRKLLEHFDQFPEAAIHAISDNVMHTVPLMGGMIAFHPSAFVMKSQIRSIDSVIEFSGDLNKHGMDQTVLNLRIWPFMKQETVQHRLSGSKTFEGAMHTFTEVPSIGFSDINPEVIDRDGDFAAYIGQRCEEPIAAFRFYSRFISPEVQRVLNVEKGAFKLLGWTDYL